MSHRAVIGLGFGDEGKGVTTEYLCSQNPEDTLVVRFSGGQQAGHKVIKGTTEHIFSHFGSGTLSGCPTYWSHHCTFDPVTLWNEYDLLHQKGVRPLIYIHPDCPVTTPYEVFKNRAPGREKEHGTCGSGFFRTKERHTHGPRLTAGILLHVGEPEVSLLLEKTRNYHELNNSPELDNMVREFNSAIANMHVYLGRHFVITDTIPNYQYKVFEGSQGLMLMEGIGTMPHCTPSDLTPRNILKETYLDEIFLVTRAYQTRHGKGPMTNREYPIDLKNTEKETNVCNTYQGEFRTSVLDLDQLIHAKKKGIDNQVGRETSVYLVVTCLDQLDEYKVTYQGTMHTFEYLTNFVDFLAYGLGLWGTVYVNDSPESKLRRIP